MTPTRAGLEPTTRKEKGKSRAKASRRRWPNRALVETAAMVLALVVVGGGIAYVVWPPGQDYLYRQASHLMASPHRHDWITARNDYLDPLDRRFPDNPYRTQTRAWRDRILLDEAEGRAKLLDSPVRTQLSDPDTEAERQYVQFSALARKDAERGDDLKAAADWDELARLIKQDDPNERKWFLLARKRADDLKKAVADRRAFVVAQLKRIDAAGLAGRFNEAATLRESLIDHYGKYNDVADLLAPATPPPVDAAAPEPAQAQDQAQAASPPPASSASPERPPEAGPAPP